MSSTITLSGGISSLLQQTSAYGWLDSTVILLTPDAAVCYLNPAAQRLESLLYHHRNAGPEERGILALPAMRELLAETCAAGAARQLKYTFVRDRSIEIPLTLNMRPVINEDSAAVEGVMLTLAEEQLQSGGWPLARLHADRQELCEQVRELSLARIENERLIRLLLTEMPIALILLDGERKVVQINRAAEALFGIQRRYAVGLSCSECLSCYTQSEQHCPVRNGQEHIEMSEIQIRTPEAGVRTLLRTAVALQEGGQDLLLEAFIDITERKTAEARLTQYREELENTVAERTAKLEQTVEELEAFSYTVSHDLRSPLRAIDGFSQALLEDYSERLDETGLDYLNRSRRAAQRMGKLIDDLLNLSRISRMRLKRQQVDVSALAGEIAEELLNSRGERSASITVQPDLQAHAEAGLVHAVLANLMSNAWKFTAGCVDTAIEIGSTLIDGEKVFFVRDNGKGFPMQYANKLFHPFQVLDPQSPASGTGIGLATVQRIIHHHNGCVWANSEPGAGATFFFTFEP
ncbi:MAG: ATP-binding protein [Thiogranum sp.]|nr:ATP-binding protein [Thiogranum sp.]